MKGLLGKKVGMTQIFDEEGIVVPITLIEAGPCYVTQVRNPKHEGYMAVQLGFEEIKLRSPRYKQKSKIHLLTSEFGYFFNKNGIIKKRTIVPLTIPGFKVLDEKKPVVLSTIVNAIGRIKTK